MKVQEPCRACLEGLARKTTALSGNDPGVLDSSLSLLEDLFDADATPPWIAGRILAHIRRRTGVWDPYATLKHREYREALAALKGLRGNIDDCLEDLLRLSALGNSTDYFTGGTFTGDIPALEGDVDRAAAAVSTESGEILMLGDNIGDFVFDLPLLRFLERGGRRCSTRSGNVRRRTTFPWRTSGALDFTICTPASYLRERATWVCRGRTSRARSKGSGRKKAPSSRRAWGISRPSANLTENVRWYI